MPCVLMYNLSGKPKETGIRVALMRYGISAKVVEPCDFGQPLGYILNVEGFGSAPAPENPFTGEMLVMYDLDERRFSGFLNALRQGRCGVTLKAVVTDTNIEWSSQELYEAVSSEHEAMKHGGSPLHHA